MLDGLFKQLKLKSNIPSNFVQHDKKMLDINVGPLKSAFMQVTNFIIYNMGIQHSNKEVITTL